MTKILFFINNLKAGGKERQLLELLKGLVNYTDFQCYLVTMSKEIHYKEFLELPVEKFFLIRKYKKDFSIYFKFASLCKTIRPDIIHTWDTMTSLYATPIAMILKIKLLNGSIRVAPKRIRIFSKRWFLNKLTFPFATSVLANSYEGLKSYRINTKKGVCIHNGFDLKRITTLQDANVLKNKLGISTVFIICMIATFSNRKDYITYIKTAIDILNSRDDITFLCIGDGDDSLFREMIPIELTEKIKFLGRQEDVESIINICDIGVLMSNPDTHGEGISNSIMEYMALGKPVIASMSGGNKELIDDEKSGFIIEPRSQIELKTKLEYLISNNQIMTKFGNEGKKIIVNKFGTDNMITKYVKLYEDIQKIKI